VSEHDPRFRRQQTSSRAGDVVRCFLRDFPGRVREHEIDRLNAAQRAARSRDTALEHTQLAADAPARRVLADHLGRAAICFHEQHLPRAA
jgi:hypothetical protein